MHDGECVRNNRRRTGEPEDTRRKRKYDNNDVVQSCVDLARYDLHLLPPSCAAVADRSAVSAAAIIASRILSVSTSADRVGLIKLAFGRRTRRAALTVNNSATMSGRPAAWPAFLSQEARSLPQRSLSVSRCSLSLLPARCTTPEYRWLRLVPGVRR